MALLIGLVPRCVTVPLQLTDAIEEVMFLFRITLHLIQSIPEGKICKPAFTFKMYTDLTLAVSETWIIVNCPRCDNGITII